MTQVTLPAVPDLTAARTSNSEIPTTNPVYQYSYNASGDQLLITDPIGRVTSFTYDDQGHRAIRDYCPFGTGSGDPPTAFTQTDQYNDFGELVLQTSYEGVVTAYVYDNMPGADGRLKEKLYYADAARPTRTPDTTTYSYDAFGRQTVVLQQGVNGDRETDNTYDSPRQPDAGGHAGGDGELRLRSGDRSGDADVHGRSLQPGQ